MLIFPNGERTPGELGVFMGGAQVALSSGTEAAWYNPAGMAKESRTVVTAGGFGVDVDEIRVNGSRELVVRPTPGFFSFTTSPTSPRSFPRFAYGFYLWWPVQHELPARFEDSRLVDQGGVPPTLVGATNLNALFPQGIGRQETARGFGELRIISPGFAFGLGLSRWLRAGMSARWERIRFEERSDSRVSFAAGGLPAPDELNGFTQTSAVFQGDAQRLIYLFGLQVDFGRSFKAGLTYRLPSQNEDGSGDVFFAQQSSLTVTSGGVGVLDNSEFLFAQGDGLPFKLRTPDEFRLGLAMRFENVTAEVDWIRTGSLGSYEVFRALNGSPASTRSFQTARLTTSLNAVNRYAAGLAVAAGDNSAFLFGYARDTSGVPGDDPVFRKVDFDTLSAGYFFSRGALSASTGLVYRSAEEGAAAFPQLGGTGSLPGNVVIKSYSLRVGFSFIF